ncbi:MAG: hypothetical protein ACI81O_002448 [Cyclobacteriaceae bacterium]|jgi:hypothetical protein
MKPVFAVVGHPNKGKSSIVATLVQDDSIAISQQSGTTQENQNLTVSIGETSYTLVDTPGFQRPTAVLAWLKEHASSADKRAAAVASFVNDTACQQAYPDEVQLLTPIVKGAAILYVVDGSRPYGAEYETEMEILRWTGQPSMALINPIESERYVEPWTQALGQYFKVVKVFNPMQADFDKQMAILESFAHLKEAWMAPLSAVVTALKQHRQTQQTDSVELLANLLADLCGYRLTQTVLTKGQAETLRPAMALSYFNTMKQKEATVFDALKHLYQYDHLDSGIYELPFEGNLFDTEQWVAWGLNRTQLAIAAGLAGAAAGALVDVALLGQSFFLGALGGGLLGGSSAWFGAGHIADYKVMGLPLGAYEVSQGPIRDRNFPYVVLARFLFLAESLRERNHARRDPLKIEEGDLADQIDKLPTREKRALHSAFDRLVNQKSVDNLAEVLQPLFGSMEAG